MVAQQTVPTEPAPEPTPAPIQTEPAPAPEQQPPEPQQVATWQGDPTGAISWSASEFITHDKTASWHTLLIIGAAVLGAIVWFITKDLVSPVVILLAGIMLSFYGGRQPKQLEYQLDDKGISVGSKHFRFSDFRTFWITAESGAFNSITLIPTKRFLLPTSLYYDPADEDRIVSIIGSHLPHEEKQTDAIDALMRRIRF